MVEEAKVDEVIVDTEQTTPEVETDTIDYKALYEESTASIDKYKKDIAGLDRKVGDLSKAQLELLKKTETDEETAKREAEEAKQAFEDEKNGLVNERSTLLKEKNDFQIQLKASELRLDLEAVKAFNFSTVEQVELYAKQLDLIRESAKSETTQNIEKGLSGVGQQNYKNNSKDDSNMPKAFAKAFE